MATYFHGNSEIQADGLQTLILMNPGYVGYADTQNPQPSNFVFLNSAGNSLSPANLSHQPPPSHTQQFVGIPLPASAANQDPSSQHEISALHGYVPRVPYNLWNPIDSAARETPRSQQGLSLSLSSQQPGYGSYRAERQNPPPASATADISPENVSGGSPSGASGVSSGICGMQSVLLSSKYLKAAQELLDEVVNVNGGIKRESSKGHNGQTTKVAGESSPPASSPGEGPTKRGTELSTAERQEIQMKKAKLVSMLDEVEQRYRQYHHQMQIVISSFEQAAGIGSAKTYTALALQTISKQFRCLKDAISNQIRSASKSLGEEEGSGGKIEGSRLKFVDHQLRQQRALQQLGMMQHNAWRPQRGLPERSVSVLRAWLFEHFLHPYPKDSDKHMLAKQTGLTRSQVSNWFINARVRLWKPMVEEMYMEEIKEHEQNGSDDKSTKRDHPDEDSASKSPTTPHEKNPIKEKSKQENRTNQNPASTLPASPIGQNLQKPPGFTLIRPAMERFSPKKPRNDEMTSGSIPTMDVKPSDTSNEQVCMKFGNERQDRDGYSLMTGPTNFISAFGSYPIGEIGRFDPEQFAPRFSGNAVSLTLGLPHCENLSLSGNHQNFGIPNQNIPMGRRVEMGDPDEYGTLNGAPNSHSPGVYDTIDIQNRKRFAAQLLPDFVA